MIILSVVKKYKWVFSIYVRWDCLYAWQVNIPEHHKNEHKNKIRYSYRDGWFFFFFFVETVVSPSHLFLFYYYYYIQRKNDDGKKERKTNEHFPLPFIKLSFSKRNS